MSKEISPDTESKILELGAKGRQQLSAGDLIGAEQSFLKAWESLPEPRVDFEYAQSMSVAMVEFYRDTNQPEKAKEWLGLARQAYGSGTAQDATIGFLWGTVLYKSGDLDGAYAEFDKLYKKYKRRPFQGEEKEYLDFYQSRAKVK